MAYVTEKKRTLSYGTAQPRRSPATGLVIWAVLLVIICAALLAAWHFDIKPDLDKGIWP